jgi:hypothetical protein
MAEVRVTEEVEAPAQAVWDLLGDFGGVAKWSGSITSCEVEGQGVGAVRTLGMPGGLTLRERLESYEPAARRLSYSIVEPAPLPMTGYLSQLEVRDGGSGRCTVDWHGKFEPKGAPEEQVAKLVRGIYTGGIAAVKKELGS